MNQFPAIETNNKLQLRQIVFQEFSQNLIQELIEIDKELIQANRPIKASYLTKK